MVEFVTFPTSKAAIVHLRRGLHFRSNDTEFMLHATSIFMC